MAHFWRLSYYFLVVIWVYSALESIVLSLPIDTDSPLLNTTKQSSGFLPPGWDEFCTLKGESDDKLKHYFCDIKKSFSGKWNFPELRDHIDKKTVKYKFDIRCELPANISLPWPLKARNLKHLDIETCELDDFLRENIQQFSANIPDELEYLHVINSVVIINIMDLKNIAMSISELHKDFNCGHEETIRHYTFRNVSFAYGKSKENFLTSMFNNDTYFMPREIINTGSGMVPKSRLISHKCVYKKLEYVDLSISNQTSKFPELPTENSIFPSLKVLNLSDTGRLSFAEAHRKWFRYYPKLEVIDLSYNFFTELEFDKAADEWDIPMLTMNISHNNISEFKVDKLEELIKMKNLFIDFSHNPLNCSCTEARQLIAYVNDPSKWLLPEYRRYNYMKDLECMHPKSIRGKRLADLTSGGSKEKIAVEIVVFLSLLSVVLIIAIPNCIQ